MLLKLKIVVFVYMNTTLKKDNYGKNYFVDLDNKNSKE